MSRVESYDFLCERMRLPETSYTVADSLPILFFGNLFKAKVASIGLNPSGKEYLGPNGELLYGKSRRFETLSALRATSRQALSEDQCNLAIRRMLAYFNEGRSYDAWFNHLGRVARGMGLSYIEGDMVHLDLVQEATQPTWSSLREVSRSEARNLLERDVPFLRRLMQEFSFEAVLCNGRTVLENVTALTNGAIKPLGEIRRLTYYAGTGRVGRSRFRLFGWNIPLHQPTGLTSDDEVRLGSVFGG